MPWGSHRHAAPAAVRRAVLTRDGNHCTAITDGVRCSARATEVHHIVEHDDGGPDTEDNLTSLCAWHHRKLTAAYANRVRWKHTTKRPTPPHPGLRQ